MLTLFLILAGSQPNPREDKIYQAFSASVMPDRFCFPSRYLALRELPKKKFFIGLEAQKMKNYPTFVCVIFEIYVRLSISTTLSIIHLKLLILSLQPLHTHFNMHPSPGLIYIGLNHHIFFRRKNELNEYKDITFI